MNQLKTNTGVDQATGLINPSFDPTLCKVWATKTLFGEAKPLKVAIFTLTYNRLDYTKRMFSAVKKFTNYQYDHYVVDNGSTDGTVEYLGKKDLKVIYNKVNVGISKASNQALDAIGNNYDIIIKMDNDCEVESDKWLETIIDVYERSGQYIISPYVEGLVDSPGGVKRIRNGYIGRHTLGLTTHLGGLCIAAPYKVYQGFRWEEEDFLHSSQDYIFSQHCLKQRYALAYLENIRVMHMDTTVGQQEKYPEYFEKRMKEKTIRYEKK
jgi:glycosyltransferase involved in cell wall biosynthesis